MMIPGVSCTCSKYSHYKLPNGSVGSDFVTWLSSQIDSLLKAPFILRGCWYLFLRCCSETQWSGRAHTYVACLVGAYSVGWNIILKTWLPRLKDVHDGDLNHD